MRHGYAMIRDAVKKCPLSLLAVKDKKLLDIAERMMPYSIGIEFEANVKDSVFQEHTCDRWILLDQRLRKQFPDLIDVNFDKNEQRIRIPSGIKGMIVLYEFCDWMKDNMELNMSSGLHYHIDFTDVPYFWKETLDIIRKNEGWILTALNSWRYKGTFNSWAFSTTKTAVKAHEYYKTVEVRIGEMTFDYDLIIKRILHLQNIARNLKTNILNTEKQEKSSLKSPKRTKVKKISMARIMELAALTNETTLSVAAAFINDGYILTS